MTDFHAVYVCVEGNFEHCGSLVGESTASAEKAVAAMSAKAKEREDGKTAATATTGRNSWTLKKVPVRFCQRLRRSSRTLSRSRFSYISSLATEFKKIS